MAGGVGKYDNLCTFLRDASRGEAVALIVLGGVRGHGSSTQLMVDMTTDPHGAIALMRELASALILSSDDLLTTARELQRRIDQGDSLDDYTGEET